MTFVVSDIIISVGYTHQPTVVAFEQQGATCSAVEEQCACQTYAAFDRGAAMKFG